MPTPSIAIAGSVSLIQAGLIRRRRKECWPSSGGTSCNPQLGTNRQYVMSLFTGAPINNRDNSTGTGPLTESDRYTEWEGAPPPETIFIFTDQGINSCVGTECGLEDFPQFPIRTFWTQESIEGNP